MTASMLSHVSDIQRRPGITHGAMLVFAAAVIALPDGLLSQQCQSPPNHPRLVAQLGHASGFKSVAFSHDGRTALTGSSDKTARLWDVATGKQLRSFEGHAAYILSVAFSPDGRTVLTGSDDNTARLWDVTTGQELRRFEGRSDSVTSVAFSPDGRAALTGSKDKTARLWDVATGKELRRFVGHSFSITSVAFSPDGQTALTGSRDRTARLWDVATGQELRRFEGHSSSITSVAFSPDGRTVLTGSWDDTARLWDVATGHELRRFVGDNSCVAFSRDGRTALTGGDIDETARLWDVTTGQELRRFDGRTDPIYSVTFSPDGRTALTGGYGKTARLWDMATGKELRRFEGHSGSVTSVAFSPDGRAALTGSKDKTARLWDVATGKELRRFVGHSDGIIDSTFSPDGRTALTGSRDRTARLWDVATGQELRRFEGDLNWILSVSFSPDGGTVLTGSHNDTAHLWDVATRRELRRFEGGISCVAFSPDGRTALMGSFDGSARLWDVATGQELRRFEERSDSIAIYSITFSPDGRTALTGGYGKTARLWDVATGKQLRSFEGHAGSIFSVTFSPNGHFVLTGSQDGTARIWEASSGRELCSLINFNNGSWAVTDPAGRFDASDPNTIEGLHWAVGNEPIDLAQLKDRYYEPGLLAKVMGFNKEPLRDVTAFTDPKLHPEVKLAAPTKDTASLGVSLTNRGGGIGRVVVRINGKEFSADARGPQPDQNAKQVELSIDLKDSPLVVPGKSNKIEVFAYNAEGYLSSRGATVVYEAPGIAGLEEPHLWAIVAGTSDYRGEQIELKFAAKDAEDFAAALTVGGKRLFGAERVHLTLLSTMQQDETKKPTRANLLRAFEAAKSAKPTDVLVVYLAGHGVNYGGQDGDFYYLTADALTADLTDPAVRTQATISSAELTELVKQIPAAERQVLILDTCAAGKFLDKLTEKREVESSQIRAIDRVKSRTGMHVLAGCAADSVSYEASRYGQGLLTYSLLLGMRGGALQDDEYLDVVRWFDFAATRVPELARDFGGIQRPLVSSPRGNTFPIARLTGEDKAAVPLRAVRPLFLRSSFQDDKRFRDDLAVTKEVDAALRDVETRGFDAPLVFVDAIECPDAYQMSGRYHREAGKVTVEVRLFKGEAELPAFTVTGEEKDVPSLAKRIAETALKQCEQAK